ncbi:hypothetical protein Klosneuvirus_1_254 [Klosneuvirus KNV1]|uniref:Uncharacterized protein n=1 Tax=Klosneuvirus KNV1 TaxID=1977640 RepID=A0A1V0SI56_9VIRU|nr:hypothetical protein Klosneuvirus_1_254 [Klosneuvirus KNV1]
MSTISSMLQTNNQWSGFNLPAQYGKSNPVTTQLKNTPTHYLVGSLCQPVSYNGSTRSYSSEGRSSIGIAYCQHTPVHR